MQTTEVRHPRSCNGPMKSMTYDTFVHGDVKICMLMGKLCIDATLTTRLSKLREYSKPMLKTARGWTSAGFDATRPSSPA